MKILICAPLQDAEIKKIQEHFKNDIFIINRKPTQENIDQVDVIIGNPKLNLNLNQEHLQEILLNSAGSDQYIKTGILNENTKLTNASGSYGNAISEQVIGMMITLCKNLKTYALQMNEGNWNPLKTGKEIYHSRVCIVGYGDIGYEIARRLKTFDCHITAIKRRVQDDLPYVDEVSSLDQLDKLLPTMDFVILSLPQSKETYHLFNTEKLLKMKKDAVLINVGRGSAIDTNDLIEVLNQEHLYGVGLDVVEEEPLSNTSPLWKFENVLITPHSSGGFVWQSVRNYYTELVIRNIEHLKNKETLENEVDFQTGYRKVVTYKK